jgi:hypothetical protein
MFVDNSAGFDSLLHEVSAEVGTLGQDGQMIDSMDNRRRAGGAPAQWYTDPMGRHQHRYWDGTAWTEHVADDGLSSTDPLYEPSPDSADQTDASQNHYSPEVQALLPALHPPSANGDQHLWQEHYVGRMDAVRRLGELGDRSAVAPLVEVATKPAVEYDSLRLAAIEALGVVGDLSAAPPVIAAFLAGDMDLGDDTAPTIGSMLARTADQAALAPLVEKMSSANEEFEDDYPDWYNPYDPEFYMSTPREVQDKVSNTCAAILSFAGEQGMECLFTALGCPRDSVARRLGGVEDPPVDRLIQAAGAPEGNVRAAALVALCVVESRGIIRRGEIEGMLKAALDDEDERVRDAASDLLRWYPPDDQA